MKPVNFILIATVTAVISHAFALHFIPTGIMSIAMNKIPLKGIETAQKVIKAEATENTISTAIIAQQGINVAMPSERIDHHQRLVVRATPDILYTACIYDLSDGPLHITTPTIGGYTSISAFAHNTDNFFTQDDRTAINNKLDITLMLSDKGNVAAEGSTPIVSPTQKGIVLFRVLIESEADLNKHIQRQRQARCTTLKT